MTRTDEPTIQELFDLTGKAALITGGSGWLGGSFARALAEAGASVVVSSRDKARADETAAALPSPGGAAHFGVQLDHMDADSIEAGFRDAVAAAGQARRPRQQRPRSELQEHRRRDVRGVRPPPG